MSRGKKEPKRDMSGEAVLQTSRALELGATGLPEDGLAMLPLPLESLVRMLLLPHVKLQPAAVDPQPAEK